MRRFLSALVVCFLGACSRTNPEATVLTSGEARTVRVDSRKKWNGSGVLLLEGSRYYVSVSPPDQIWLDASICSTAEGYPSFLPHWLRFLQRAPDRNLFALMGAYGRNGSCAFLIGLHREFVANKQEELFLFANDVPGFYRNNSGSIEVIIELQE